ncbi:MAG: hypothetical protein JXA13_10145 [Anaerolineales bacterium]|nr:hypothetical protein [Anaerolineales bacterium]
MPATSASSASYVRFSDKLTDGMNDISKIIQDNKQTMDSIQEIGIEMTTTIAAIGGAVIKYVKMIDGFLDTVVPLIEKVPFIDKKIVNFAQDAQKLSQTILDACNNSEKVAGDVNSALTKGDVGKLKGYAGDLKNLSKGLQGVAARIK